VPVLALEDKWALKKGRTGESFSNLKIQSMRNSALYFERGSGDPIPMGIWDQPAFET